MKLTHKIGLFLSLGTITSTGFAVDGYKELKFGSTIEQVKKSKICQSKWMNLPNEGLLTLGCTKFKFGKDLTYGYAFFIDKKLARISVIVPRNKVLSVSEGMLEKYGPPSSQPENAPKEYIPNTNWDVGFDNDTVIYRLSIDAKGIDTTLLIYTTPDFDEKIKQKNKADIKDDL